jgi:nicotinamidase-related amidase
MTTSPDRLNIESSLLLIVDVQGKLARLVDESESVIHQIGRLVDGCRLLEIPIVWAEQLPEKLGTTVPEVASKLEGISPASKSSFGCCDDPDLYQSLKGLGRQQIMLCGIETHVCVWQTAAVLRGDDYQVHLISDATSSRSSINREIAFRRMESAGVHMSNVEMALFELMKDANHPCFRQVTGLLK